MCHLISFTAIYCPPAVSINVYFLPACCQAAFLELLHIYISPTLLFSSLFAAPSMNMKSDLQMSCSYPQKGTQITKFRVLHSSLQTEIWFSSTRHANNIQVLKLTCKRKHLLCSLNQATAVNMIVTNIMFCPSLSSKRVELVVFPK